MKKVYKVEDLCCAHCAQKIEDAINKINGVQRAALNFFTLKLTVEAEENDLPRIMKEAQKAAKRIEPDCTIVL